MQGNFRYPGEFEKVSDVFMTWMPDYIDSSEHDNRATCVQVVKALQGQAQLHINGGAEGVIEKAKKRLTDDGVDISDIKFTEFEDTNFYVRDNGPSVMIDDHGNRKVINPGWSYYGVIDPDSEEAKIARRAGMNMAVSMDLYDIVSSELVSEGGDREFNGRGVMMAIEDTEVRKRNPQYTKAEVEAEYKKLYNVEKIIWIPKPIIEDDDFRMGPLEQKDGYPVFGSSFAAHIDEMCRFIDHNKVILAEVTDEEAAASNANKITKERLDEAYEVLKNATDVDGKPFEIIRMPIPEAIEFVLKPGEEDYDLFKGFIDEMGGKFEDGTPWPDGDAHFYAAAGYCNFLMCNDVVVGQRYYSEGMDPKVKEKDEQAEEVLKKSFPDRKVVMVDALALNLSGGGVHCWTKEVAASGKK
ncbi:agmatine deiminase family protein [Lactobacillus sp. YT155]|uniref:agmatine deiminase family protein n=1 Tax=Lactobacillus sp. YT155 TaxID=3060955 RepID=UPI00265F51D0|nr:agmatine deiminase family protein [Lactobacillus sp. YT155]MDO1604708.1 agmatine deiminase family protein [Lactobacillus sp. YT155]